MRMISERATHIPGEDTQVWLSGLFKNVIEAIVETGDNEALRSEFLEKFAKAYEDVRFYTFVQIAYATPPHPLEKSQTVLTSPEAISQIRNKAQKPSTSSSPYFHPATRSRAPSTNSRTSTSNPAKRTRSSSPLIPTRSAPKTPGSPSSETTSPNPSGNPSSASWSTTSSPGSVVPNCSWTS